MEQSSSRTQLNKPIGDLAVHVGRYLQRGGLTVATAESCTGGWIAKVFTDIAGSSNWFAAGVVTYSNTSKMELLNVSAKALEECGAVSERVAIAMATGALKRLKSDLAVAVTGIAGPSGGSLDKPVGTVWVAWARRKGSRSQATACLHHFRGGRRQIRMQAVRAALLGLLRI